MDFLTGMPYWGIILLVLFNAFLVSRMNIKVRKEDEREDRDQPWTSGKGSSQETAGKPFR